MKKIITVLAILVLVAGFAFAAEEHKIFVKADVTALVPAFQLTYSTVTTNPAVGDPAASASYSATGSYTPNATEANAIDVGFNLDENGTVVVTAKLGNAAKQKQNYKLTFSDGVFTVNRDAVSGSFAPTSIVASAGTAFKGVKTITATDDYIQVNFNGTKAVAGSTLGTATYTYTADDTIDPGVYYANLVMTVTTV